VVRRIVGAFVKFDVLKNLFPADQWDVGFLSIENLQICAFSPIKWIFHASVKPCLKLVNEVDYNFGFPNALVLVRKTEVTLDYSLNDEAERIFEAHGFAYQKSYIEIYTNFKMAAILAGVAVRAKNSLVYSRKFGFDCKICCYGFQEIIVDVPAVTPDLGFLKACDNCDDCRRNCPAGAIHNQREPFWLDSTACAAFFVMSYHDTIPSIKKYWHKYVHPEIELETVKSIRNWNQLAWNANGYKIPDGPGNRGQTPCKDGKPVYPPICRECQVQPKCSKWNGRYPYTL
jgi:ferredoxin